MVCGMLCACVSGYSWVRRRTVSTACSPPETSVKLKPCDSAAELIGKTAKCSKVADMSSSAPEGNSGGDDESVFRDYFCSFSNAAPEITDRARAGTLNPMRCVRAEPPTTSTRDDESVEEQVLEIYMHTGSQDKDTKPSPVMLRCSAQDARPRSGTTDVERAERALYTHIRTLKSVRDNM